MFAKFRKHVEKSIVDYYYNFQNYRMAGFDKAKGAMKGKRKGRDSDNEGTDTGDEDVGGNDGGGKKMSKPSAAAQRPKVWRVLPWPRLQHRVLVYPEGLHELPEPFLSKILDTLFSFGACGLHLRVGACGGNSVTQR